MMKKHSRWLVAVSVLALSSAMAGMSAAQDADTGDGEEEVVVTAQRRSERLVDVPMSVVAVSGATIEKAGVRSILDLGAVAPGVQVNFAGAATQPSIRGITSLTNAVGYENNVAIYVDGFYSPDMLSINSDLGNVSSIEVLKGPQGALYGRNATGGAILINTLKPSDVLTGRFEASYATFNDWKTSAYISGPISDTVRYSLAGYYRESDGYITFAPGPRSGDAAPLRQGSFRAKLQWDVTEDLTATFGYNYGLSDDGRGILFTTQDRRPAFLGPAAPLGQVAYNYNNINKGTVNEYTLTVVYDTSFGTISSYSGYAQRKSAQEFDFDGSYQDLSSSVFRFGQNTYQQGLDFAITSIENLDLIVGLSYYHDRVRSLPPYYRQSYGANRVPNNSLQLDLTTEAYAFYADATYRVTDALSINVGGRYASETKDIAFVLTGTGAFPRTTGSETWSRFTPRASIRYEIAPKTNIYATYSEGFRSGAWPTTITRPALLIPIKEEVVTNYEIGVKTSQDNFTLEAAAFYSDDKNLQVSVVTPICVGTTCTATGITANAPKAEVYGVEAKLSYSPVEGLTINAGGAYLHAEYIIFPNATGNGLNGATGLNISGQSQDWSGQQMARSPEFAGNIGIEYEVPMFTGNLLMSVNANYSGSFVNSNPSLYGPAAGALAKVQRYRTSPYTLVNAQATWTDANDQFSIKVFALNLTDEDYLLAYNGGTYGDYKLPNTPRQFGIQIGYRF